ITPFLLAVVLESETAGKQYRVPADADHIAIKKATEALDSNEIKNWIPDEELPYLRSIFNVHVYGINKWALLFDARQKLALASLVRLVNRLYKTMDTEDLQLKQGIIVCIALAVDRLADFNSNIARWANHRESSAATFGRQALGMVWDYCETVPISSSTGSLSGSIDWVFRVCNELAKANLCIGQARQVSAANHTLPDDSASLLFTDPPYYDAVPYANLSDFFYVWLRKSLNQVLPELFANIETPKIGEAVQLAERNEIYAYKTKEYFEKLMAESFGHARRYVQKTSLGVIVFAHKNTSAWETLLSAVIKSGWIITASWSIDTEMGSRLRAQGSAALASSIHLVCRPRTNDNDIGSWKDVLDELPGRLHEWMPRLAEEGVVGADAIFACLGPALEIFSRYSSVEKTSGELVPLKEYLEHVWGAIAKEALNTVLAGADSSSLEEDARLTVIWLWTLTTSDSSSTETPDSEEEIEDESPKTAKTSGYCLDYDTARKIAQGLGAHLDSMKSLVEIKGDTAKLLSVEERTAYLFGKQSTMDQKPKKKEQVQLSLFDVLEENEADPEWSLEKTFKQGKTQLDKVHQSMILFAANRGEALKAFIVKEGIGKNPAFWNLAQSLSALYPKDSQEKRWVDGVLARKKSLGF
ncbi:MAG: DUF1156 domain-containing protein, partial [Candidatus Margulisiibacteriota bacterium]